ncbi:helix-turn-helix domain-containing protein [Actinomadura sp. 9N407]|uniref:helix-turn-helix domain-containing protein n=1 Tax=Actinomadura sp. 9N407 TaxID=3375154 RepID=UPI0037A9EF5D
MVSVTTVSGAPSGSRPSPASSLAQGDPLVPRMLLGKRLRELREARDLSRAEVSMRVGASPSKVTRLERGDSQARPEDVAELLAAYGLHDEAERSTLLTIAEQTDARAWWYRYRDAVPPSMRRYLSAEEGARLVRCFDDRYVPDLLQTEAYARELLRNGHSAASERATSRHVDLLARRQRFLRRRPRPLNLWVVLDEAVLWRPVGNAATMRDQLIHLTQICWRPNVTVQIAPYKIRDSVPAARPLTLVRFPQVGLPDLVHLDGTYPSRQAEIERHWHMFNTLVTEAAPPEQTPKIIERILADR